MGTSHSPCVMSNTEQFFVKLCSCGVVHLNFGPTVVNATPETIIAITETLREISSELRKRLSQEDSVNGHQAAIDFDGNVIRGRFPSPTA